MDAIELVKFVATYVMPVALAVGLFVELFVIGRPGRGRHVAR